MFACSEQRQDNTSVLCFDKCKESKAMKEQQLLERITLNPKVMVGKPVIKGTRLTVEYILNLLAHGATVTEILQEYKGLTQEDIQACLLFATKSLENRYFHGARPTCSTRLITLTQEITLICLWRKKRSVFRP
jgi:uncharacterized protein (DUF433 family)